MILPVRQFHRKTTCTHVELAQRTAQGEPATPDTRNPEAQRVRVQGGVEEDQLEAAFSFFLGKGKIKFHQHAESQLIFPKPKNRWILPNLKTAQHKPNIKTRHRKNTKPNRKRHNRQLHSQRSVLFPTQMGESYWPRSPRTPPISLVANSLHLETSNCFRRFLGHLPLLLSSHFLKGDASILSMGSPPNLMAKEHG